MLWPVRGGAPAGHHFCPASPASAIRHLSGGSPGARSRPARPPGSIRKRKSLNEFPGLLCKRLTLF